MLQSHDIQLMMKVKVLIRISQAKPLPNHSKL